MTSAQAQAPYSTSTRTPPVYRCEQGGRVIYSDEPCVGGRVIDATPTQGVDKMTGKTRKGKDVQRDEHNQMFDQAIRPLTGKSHAEMDVERRRYPLTAKDKLHCKALDFQLPQLEARAAQAAGAAKQEAEGALYRARRDYFGLEC